MSEVLRGLLTSSSKNSGILRSKDTHHAFTLATYKSTRHQAVNHALLTLPLFKPLYALDGYKASVRVSDNNDCLALIVNEPLELMSDDFGVLKVGGDGRPDCQRWVETERSLDSHAWTRNRRQYSKRSRCPMLHGWMKRIVGFSEVETVASAILTC